MRLKINIFKWFKDQIVENNRINKEKNQKIDKLRSKINDKIFYIAQTQGEYKLFEFQRELYILIHGTDQNIERGILSDTVYTLTNDQIGGWFFRNQYSQHEFIIENFCLKVVNLSKMSKYL